MSDERLLVLVPFRNEQLFLPAFFDALDGIADQIVGLDDHSSDESATLFRSLGGHVVDINLPNDWTQGGEVFSRQTLLNAGRDLGGTHFLWLDADEVPSDELRRHLRTAILDLSQGQALELLWVNAWKDSLHYRRRWLLDDPGYRPFAHADIPAAAITGQRLHFPRVPMVTGVQSKRLSKDHGAIIHLQYCNWQRARAKQAWYQVSERVETSRSPLQIGLRYRDTHHLRLGHLRRMPKAWLISPSTESSLSIDESSTDVGRRDSISRSLALMSEEPIESFEPLDIWDVPELLAHFECLTGRPPRPRLIWTPILYLADALDRTRLTSTATKILEVLRRILRRP